MSTVVPFAGEGWRYLIVTEADSVDRSAPEFDDTSWPVGQAPFGNLGFSNIRQVLGWEDPPNTDLGSPDVAFWVRRTITATTDVTVTVRVDGLVRVYWNGVLLADPGESWKHVAAGISSVQIPAGALTGNDTLAIYILDDVEDPTTDFTYLDARVEAASGNAPALRGRQRGDGRASSSAPRGRQVGSRQASLRGRGFI